MTNERQRSGRELWQHYLSLFWYFKLVPMAVSVSPKNPWSHQGNGENWELRRCLHWAERWGKNAGISGWWDDDDDCWILPKFIGTCFSGRRRKHRIYGQIGHGHKFWVAHCTHFPHILVITPLVTKLSHQQFYYLYKTQYFRLCISECRESS